MLPTFLLQPSEFATFDTELNSPNLLPDDATEPQIGFADLLGLSARPLPAPILPAGLQLPDGGKQLPLPSQPGSQPNLAQVTVDAMRPAGLPGAATLPDELAELAGSLQPQRSAVNPPQAARSFVIPLETQSVTLPVATPATEAGAAGRERLSLPGIAVATVTEATTGTPARTEFQVAGTVATPRGVAEQLQGSAQPRPVPNAPATGAELAANLNLETKNLVRPLPDRRPATAPAGADALRIPVTPDAEAPRDLRPTLPPVTSPAMSAQSPATTPAIAPVTGDAVQAPVTHTAPAAAPSFVQPVVDTPAPTATLPGRIDVPVREGAWGEQLGQQLQLMASNRLQTAEIRLTPAELGPLRVQVAIEDGAANVTFHAQHAVTREAIEQALPRLREMLAENGVQLNQANIGEQEVQHGGRQPGQETRGTSRGQAALTADTEVNEGDAGVSRQRNPESLVDTFA